MSYKTQSAILHQYNPNIIRALLSIKVGERKLPNLQPNEVLIKTAFSPVNPSDIAFLQGGYNVVKPLPCVPGFEASGTVEETGKNARHLLGKKVSSFVQSDYDGSWSENFVANARDCMVLKEGKIVWKCRNCGFLHEGTKAPKLCPACLHPQSYFEIKAYNY